MSSAGTKPGMDSSAKVQAKLCALLVEDNPLDATLVLRALYKEGFDVTADVVQDESAFTRALRARPPEVVLADYNLPNWRGMETLDVLRREGLDIPMILVSGALGDMSAVECIKQGATDYVLKDRLARLPSVVRRALAEKDIREQRKRAEAALQEHKYALDQHAIVSTADVQGAITYANDKFCAISGYSRDELLGQNHRMLNSGYHPREFFEQMYRTIGDGQVWRGEIRNRTKDGSFFWVDATIVPFLDASGKPRQYMAIRTDITERKHAEEDLAKKAADLARSNADLEQFAYIASHDLQEPLRMVTAYTQLLAERYKGKLDENADKFIGYASEGALRMQVLIQDLLAFSRVGRNGVASASVDCNAVMEEVRQTLSTAIQESGTLITHGKLPAIWTDRTQITQVFQNLIGNAIKFRGKEPPVISVEAEELDHQWLFRVSDNGIGIAPEYAENIFVAFQRLHARTEYPGNGIGLAICKKIVEHYGGRIWVESQAGSGSTFKFTMPILAPDSQNEAGK